MQKDSQTSTQSSCASSLTFASSHLLQAEYPALFFFFFFFFFFITLRLYFPAERIIAGCLCIYLNDGNLETACSQRNLRFFPESPRQQLFFPALRSCGRARTSHLLLRLSLCRRPSYPHSFIPMRAGHCQHNSKEGPKPLRWDALGDFWTFHTKTMWWTRGFVEECKWSAWWSPKHGEESQMVWPHLKILWHDEDNPAGIVKGERRRGRQMKRWEYNIEEWTWMDLKIPWGQEKTDKGGKVLLQCHRWCPDDRQY